MFPGSQEGTALEGEYIRMSILQPLPQLEEAMRRMRRTVESLS